MRIGIGGWGVVWPLSAGADLVDVRGCLAVRWRLEVELAAEGAADVVVEGAAVEMFDSTRNGGGRRTLPARVRRRMLPLRPMLLAALLLASSPWLSSSATQRSQRSHPRNVAKLDQLTTETGDTRSWKMPTKQTMKMMTEQTCWSMTVESATRGQKS